MTRLKDKISDRNLAILFGVLLVIIVLLVWRQVVRLTTEPAWVASTSIEAGQLVTRDMLEIGRSSQAANSLQDPTQIIGRTLRVKVESGEVFRVADFTSPSRQGLSKVVPEGRVLYTLVPDQTSIPHTQFSAGDRIDVVVRGARGVRTVAQNVIVMGALQPPKAYRNGGNGRASLTQLVNRSTGDATSTGTPLVLAVKPLDIYPLAGIGTQERISLVLHSASDVSNGAMVQIRPEYQHRTVEIYNGNERENVGVVR